MKTFPTGVSATLERGRQGPAVAVPSWETHGESDDMARGPADVTIVIASRNRWPDLQRSLPRHQGPVILIDNGSTDGTADLVRTHFPHVKVVPVENNLGAIARNLGVRLAATPYVAFSDDDSWWAPGALSRASALLAAHPDVGLIAARILVGPAQRLDPTCSMMTESPLGRRDDLPGPSVLGFVACGAVVRRDAFLAAGGFDDIIFFMGEEERLALDLATLGWAQVYVDDVIAHHFPSGARDRNAASILQARNRFLTAVLRRPWPVVANHLVHAFLAERTDRLGLMRAIPKLPRALAHRRRLPTEVEQARRRLEPGRR
jgi:GT2 family glycosyltransferase